MGYSLYEQPAFRRGAGNDFRPGGLGLTEELAEACKLRPGERTLDLGCGVGSTASYLLEHWGVRVCALDSSETLLAEARERDSRVRWIRGWAEELPFPDDSFDAVFSECFLSALESPTRVLSEIRRVLRPGGRLAVTDIYIRNPAYSGALRNLPAATCLRSADTRLSTARELAQAGFVVQMWRDRSEVLKSFIASLLFSYGSADLFWQAFTGAGNASREAAILARPGYFMLVAECQEAALGTDDSPASARLPVADPKSG